MNISNFFIKIQNSGTLDFPLNRQHFSKAALEFSEGIEHVDSRKTCLKQLKKQKNKKNKKNQIDIDRHRNFS